MLLECSHAELLDMVALMHHDDKEYDALKHYATIKGFSVTLDVAVHTERYQ